MPHEKAAGNRAFRLLTAGLLIFLALPQTVRAGAGLGEDPYEIGEKLFAREKHGTALKYYRKALVRNDVRAYYRMGLIYEAAGNVRDAMRNYRRFIDLGQLEDAQRGDAIVRLGTLEERQSLETRRTSELLERGRRLLKEGKYREAEKVLLQAVSQDKAGAEAHFYLGEVYMQLEEYGKAKSEYGRAKRSY